MLEQQMLSKAQITFPALEDRKPAPNIGMYCNRHEDRLFVTAVGPLIATPFTYLRSSDSLDDDTDRQALPEDHPVRRVALAAQSALGHSLGLAHAYCEGGINDIEKCLRLGINIAATPGFSSLAYIGGTTRETARQVFKQEQLPAATVTGVACLPFNFIVTIEAEYALHGIRRDPK